MNVEIQGNPSSQQWFAVRVRSHAEKSVAAIARYNGFEAFLPLYRSLSRWSGLAEPTDAPLFPSYVFCRISSNSQLQLRTLPGVQQLGGYEKGCVPADDEEIAALQAMTQSGLSASPWRFSKTGLPVRLENGPLTGIAGLLITVRKSYRLILSVSALSRSVAVEIERDWATPVRSAGLQTTANAFAQPLAERSPYV
jgi:transcription antitermination factor NusG